jgi:hypothetical protein
VGAGARKQLFCNPIFLSGLQMCCFVRGLMIRAFPNAPKRRNARGGKKLKPLAERFPKALIRSVFLFSVIFKSAIKCHNAAFGLHLTFADTRRAGFETLSFPQRNVARLAGIRCCCEFFPGVNRKKKLTVLTVRISVH